MSSRNLETRTKILRAALELLEASSSSGVRMSDIANRVGITRQALYLHFKARADLLIETTYYLDQLKGSEERLAASRAAPSGVARLDAYIEAWGNYIPEIYGVAKALLAMSDTDEAARAAWDKRMLDMKEGCEAAIGALHTDGMLSPDYPLSDATDILWTMLSVRSWEQLTIRCGWSQEKYIKTQKSVARQIFVIAKGAD